MSLVDLLEGETTVTESMAKGNFPLRARRSSRRCFRSSADRSPHGSGCNEPSRYPYGVGFEKAKEKKEQEILKKGDRCSLEVEQEEADDDEAEKEDGDADEDDEEEKG